MIADNSLDGLPLDTDSQRQAKELVKEREIHFERRELQAKDRPDVTVKHHLAEVEGGGGLRRNVVFLDELKPMNLGLLEDVLVPIMSR